jgi:D-cysteine desulfhydrase
VEAVRELETQIRLGLGPTAPFDALVAACGSGGTIAGLSLGSALYLEGTPVLGMAVCDDTAYFDALVERIVGEAEQYLPPGTKRASFTIIDDFIGPGYGMASDEQKAFLVEVAEKTGLVLDPVYSGKALFGLSRLHEKPRRVLFVHTGGLPGLLAQHAEFAAQLSAMR